MNMNEVIEEHRLETGAERVHLSLGPNATPEGVRLELRRLADKMKEYDSFSELEQEKAKVARLKALIRKICALSKSDISEFTTQNKEVARLKTKLFGLTDMATNVDVKSDIVWMKAQHKN